jgi:hypothetical protein
MTMALPLGFEFSEAKSEQVEEAFTVMEKALAGDDVWVIMIKNCDPGEVHPWFWGNIGPRYQLPDIKNYIITEIATGYVLCLAPGLENKSNSRTERLLPGPHCNFPGEVLHQ